MSNYAVFKDEVEPLFENHESIIIQEVNQRRFFLRTKDDQLILKTFRYYTNADVLLDIKDKKEHMFGIFKVANLLGLIDEDLSVVSDKAFNKKDRYQVFLTYILPVLHEKLNVQYNHYGDDGFVLYKNDGSMDAFTYYPASGKAITKDAKFLGILNVFNGQVKV